MSGPLDMYHADIIKSNNKSGSGNSWGQGRGRRIHNRGLRIRNRFLRIHNRCFRGTNPRFRRSSTYLYAKTMRILRVMFPAEEGDEYPGFPHTNGTKLYLSNLDYCFSEEDIRELFSTVGELRRYSIHYDSSGRSKGTAEVVFSRRSDALAAVKRYNNVHLGGKPMKIEIVGTNIITPGVGTSNCTFRNSNGVLRGGQHRAGAQGQVRGAGNGRRFGRGRRHRRGHGEKVSAEALDIDLEEYRKANIETN